jgi:hypothetical protein
MAPNRVYVHIELSREAAAMMRLAEIMRDVAEDMPWREDAKEALEILKGLTDRVTTKRKAT